MQKGIIDIFKFGMAFLVIAIHTHLNENVVMKHICPIAVPFFFIVSGYLLYKKLLSTENNKSSFPCDTTLLTRTTNHTSFSNKTIDDVLVSYGKRILRLYILWTIIYLPFTVYGFIKEDSTILRGIAVFVRNFLFKGDNYMSWPLWYLLALITSLIMIRHLLKRRLSLELLLAIGGGLTILGFYIELLIKSEVSGILYSIQHLYVLTFVTQRNGIFVGFTFVVLGMMLAKYEKTLVRQKQICFIALLLSVVLQAYGVIIALHTEAFLIVFFLLQMNIPHNKYYIWLRKISMLLYFTHMIFVASIQIFLPQISCKFCLFAVSSILTLILSCAIVTMIEKYNFKLLNRLITG